MVDHTGKQYGMLTVIEFAGRQESGKLLWKCRCSCTNATVVIVAASNLVSENSKSCGCLFRSKITKHGNSKEPWYEHWKAMIKRCENPNDTAYYYYGAKGRFVCDGLHDTNHFYDCIGEKPNDGLKYTLDRKENRGNYTCGTCEQCLENKWEMNLRWATQAVQARNKGEFNNYLTMDDRTLCITDWSIETGIHLATLESRLRYGWSIEKTLTTPARYYPNRVSNKDSENSKPSNNEQHKGT